MICRPGLRAGTHNSGRLSWAKVSDTLRRREVTAYGSPLSRGRHRWLNPRHHHIFDLDIFFHAVMRAFASQPRFLDAAERGALGGDQAGVDADHAGLQRLGDPPDPAEIARI